jgi:hypothetical protein
MKKKMRSKISQNEINYFCKIPECEKDYNFFMIPVTLQKRCGVSGILKILNPFYPPANPGAISVTANMNYP